MVGLGETVWAKHRNTRYYKAKIGSIQDTLFYMVTFRDRSFSEDLYPGDITVCMIYSVEYVLQSVMYVPEVLNVKINKIFVYIRFWHQIIFL